MTADEVLARLLLDIAIIILVARACGLALRALRQPPVLGEIIGGIALGPTLLGQLPGDPSAALFPDEVRGGLMAIGGIGLVVFMFIVGLELDLRTVRRHDRLVATVSSGSIILPFACGIGLAALFHGDHNEVAGRSVGFVPFALFIATALSITAFPVLTRILMDRGWQHTRMGILATSCAAIQDGAGWILLTISLVAFEADGAGPLVRMALETAAFVGVMLTVVRPLLKAFADRLWPDDEHSANGLAVVGIGLAACAAATQFIGLHSVLGAFFFGVAFPRENPRYVQGLTTAFKPATMSILLPIFFITPGLNVDLVSMDSGAPVELLLIFLAACIGKFAGTLAGARAAGMRGADAQRLAALMNTRGLIELVVLNVGLTAGVLSQQLFSELVLMAVVTTMMAGPLLDLIDARERRRRAAGAPDAGLPSTDPRLA